jgi:PAS domain-containing protein
MSNLVIEAERLAALRHRAASRLAGNAAGKGPAARAADALSVLHALASSPVTASDALALLHELQVHQVELDLQAQELHDSRAELESALRRQIELYDFQPVGCFTIDPRLIVHELNQTGADMLEIGRENAFGLGVDAFLSSESALRLRSSLAGVDAGAHRVSLPLSLHAKGRPDRPVLASIARDPSAQRYLLTLTLADNDQGPTAPV